MNSRRSIILKAAAVVLLGLSAMAAALWVQLTFGDDYVFMFVLGFYLVLSFLDRRKRIKAPAAEGATADKRPVPPPPMPNIVTSASGHTCGRPD